MSTSPIRQVTPEQFEQQSRERYPVRSEVDYRAERTPGGAAATRLHQLATEEAANLRERRWEG